MSSRHARNEPTTRVLPVPRPRRERRPAFGGVVSYVHAGAALVVTSAGQPLVDELLSRIGLL